LPFQDPVNEKLKIYLTEGKYLTDFLGKAAVMDSRRLRNLSPTLSLCMECVGPLVVDDWRRIHGKLPSAMSTSDSRRPLVAARDR
jgi:hypothetical protein